MKFVQPIRDPKDIEAMKQDLMHQSYRNYFLFVFGINVGLRISDILPLQVKHVRNRTHGVLKEQKTGKARRFLINQQLREEIEKYTEGMDDEDYLFPSRLTGLPIKRVQAYKILSRAGKRIGLEEVGTHTLRKTFGYHYYTQKGDIVMLQKIMNHSSQQITLDYIGIGPDQIDSSLEDFYI